MAADGDLAAGDFTGFDVNFMCRNRKVEVPKSLRRDFYRSTPIQLAAVALEVPLLESLIDNGADVETPVSSGLTPLLLVLSQGAGFSAHGSMAQQQYRARIRQGVDLREGEECQGRATALHEAVRDLVPPVLADRRMDRDIAAVLAAFREGGLPIGDASLS